MKKLENKFELKLIKDGWVIAVSTNNKSLIWLICFKVEPRYYINNAGFNEKFKVATSWNEW
jgi:hypothetical protein